MFPTVDGAIQDDVTIDDIDEVIRHHHMEHVVGNSNPSPPLSMVVPQPMQAPREQASVLNPTPYVRILEQPAPRALRFRYECEGRSAGSIPGASSSNQNKTHPTIKVENYVGQAVVVVSCVTKDGPLYKPHPHNLVGREGCKKGVCTMVISPPDMICSFTSLGIQCVKKKDIEESLRNREQIKVDPYRTGFGHRTQTSNIDLNVVRLCFQVFLQGPDKDKFTVPLSPVVSEHIFDKKALSELIITKLSHHSAPVCGGTEVILLCDRITKDDVQVVFTQKHQGQVVWEGLGEFQPSDVHKQFAICFRTPRYLDETVQHPINVEIQLRRISDNTISEARPFQFTPLGDPDGLRHKRQKIDEGCLDRYLREDLPLLGAIGGNREVPKVPRATRQPFRTRVKTEPGTENMPPPSGGCFRTPAASNFVIPNVVYSTNATQPVKATVQDILAIATNQVGTAENPLVLNSTEITDSSVQETVDKFDSLDLGLDTNEMGLDPNDMNELMGINLSASMFDSGGINSSQAMDSSVAIHRGISTEENLQQISNLHSEISVLNNLCGGPTKTSG